MPKSFICTRGLFMFVYFPFIGRTERQNVHLLFFLYLTNKIVRLSVSLIGQWNSVRYGHRSLSAERWSPIKQEMPSFTKIKPEWTDVSICLTSAMKTFVLFFFFTILCLRLRQRKETEPKTEWAILFCFFFFASQHSASLFISCLFGRSIASTCFSLFRGDSLSS